MNPQRYLFAQICLCIKITQILGEYVHLFVLKWVYELFVLEKIFVAVIETKLRKPKFSKTEELIIWISRRTIAKNASRPQRNTETSYQEMKMKAESWQ